MVGISDEPIALSKAIQGMIKSVNTGNRLTQENNKDLIAGLSALKTTIQQAFLGLKNNTKGPQATVVRNDDGINSTPALLRNINSSILIQNQMLRQYLGDVPFLTSATARHETEKFRQTLLDEIKNLCSCSGGGGLPPLPPGFPRPKFDDKGRPIDDKDKSGKDDDKGKSGKDDPGKTPKPKTTESWTDRWLKKLGLDKGPTKPGAKAGSLLDSLGDGASNVLRHLKPTNIIKGLLGPEAIAGTLGSMIADRAGSSANKLKQQGKAWDNGQRLGNTALSTGGDLIAGAIAGSVFGPAGTAVGGLGGAAWGYGVANGDVRYNQTPAQIEAAERASGTYLGPGSQNNRIKQILNAHKNNKGPTIGQVGDSLVSSVTSLNNWQNSLLGKLQAWTKHNLGGIDINSPGSAAANAATAANNPFGLPTTAQRNMHQGAYDAVVAKAQANQQDLTKVLKGLLDYLVRTNLRGGGSGLGAGVSLDAYQTSGYLNQNPLAGIINAAYNTGNSSGGVDWSPGGTDPGLINPNGNSGSGSGSGSPGPGVPYNPAPGVSAPRTASNQAGWIVPTGQSQPITDQSQTSYADLQHTFRAWGKDLKVPESQIPGIIQAANNYGVSPQVIASIFAHESGFDPKNYVKPTKDANGNWIKATAKGEGMFIDGTAKSYVHGDWQDPKVAADATAHLLYDTLKASKGNYQDALAGYDFGTDNYSRLTKGQKAYIDDELKSAYFHQVQQGAVPASTPAIAPGERPVPPTPTAQTPLNPAAASPGSVPGGNAYPPASSQIPIHITPQGMIIVNHHMMGHN